MASLRPGGLTNRMPMSGGPQGRTAVSRRQRAGSGTTHIMRSRRLHEGGSARKWRRRIGLLEARRAQEPGGARADARVCAEDRTELLPPMIQPALAAAEVHLVHDSWEEPRDPTEWEPRLQAAV
ncbi:MAG: hypothetical protein ACLU9S_02545 [Oscillospiraceae bacterium]